MTARIPADARQAIAAASAALGLVRPAVAALPGGVANRCFRLRDGRHDLVLKLAGDSMAGLGASGHAALAMQALAAGAGLAPPVLRADKGSGWIVSPHVAGRMPAAADMARAPLLERVGAWLAVLHALPLPGGLPAVDFGERAAGYLARLPDGFAASLKRKLAGRRAALAAASRLVPCHHDLHHRNLIDDGVQLVAVDWEYAGAGDAAADLAACIGYHELDDESVGTLLRAYGRTDAAFARRVAALGWIFDCLWYGWNAVAGHEGLAPDPREQARLAARLAA